MYKYIKSIFCKIVSKELDFKYEFEQKLHSLIYEVEAKEETSDTRAIISYSVYKKYNENYIKYIKIRKIEYYNYEIIKEHIFTVYNDRVVCKKEQLNEAELYAIYESLKLVRDYNKRIKQRLKESK